MKITSFISNKVYGILILMIFCGSLLQAQKANHAILIVVDGLGSRILPAEGIRFPNGGKLNSSGTLAARSCIPANAEAGWVSIISGTPPSVHGVMGNRNFLGVKNETPSLPPLLPGINRGPAGIFSVIKDQNPRAKTALIYQNRNLLPYIEFSALDQHRAMDDPFSMSDAAREFLKSEKPTLLVIQTSMLVDPGRKAGYGSDSYKENIQMLNDLISDVWKAAKSAGISENCMLFISSTHGGLGIREGGLSPEEIQIPFFAFGPSVPRESIPTAPVLQSAVSPTVLYFLGFEVPAVWDDPVRCMVKNVPCVDAGVYKNTIPVPEISPEGGVIIGSEGIEVSISSPVPGAKIYYTTDGSEVTDKSSEYQKAFTMEKSGTVMAFVEKGGVKSNVAMARFIKVDPEKGYGLRYKLYENKEGRNWSSEDDIKAVEPVFQGISYTLDLNRIGLKNNQMAVVFEGYLNLSNTGEYLFNIGARKSAVAYIDGKRYAPSASSGLNNIAIQENLSAGKHRFKIIYFSEEGAGELKMTIREPGNEERAVRPGDFLSE